MKPRVLVVPAVVCLVLGVVLGAWGWGQRDASRTRMIDEAEARFDDDLLGSDDLFGSDDLGPDGVPVMGPHEAACADLLAAADLRLPGQVPGPPPGGTGDPGAPNASTVPEVPSQDLAPVLSMVLEPGRVATIVELDITEVHQAMAAMRAAVVEAATAGRDLRADPAVVVAGLELRAAVEPLC